MVKSNTDLPINQDFVLALLNSNLLNTWYMVFDTDVEIKIESVLSIPIYHIDFTTPADERERLVREINGATDLGDTAGALSRVRAALAAGQTDVVHDVLAGLAQTMIDLNKDKQAEVGRFLGWLEGRLKITPKDGKTGLDVFAGKTIIRGYLGDYQKGDGELAWDDFTYRLHQNRNRYTATLSEVEGEIQREYEGSLETLLPIKQQLARTDALIDKIVYRLYGLTDEEIELIERPGYEQALADAKAQVVGDDKIDDEEKLEKIAEGVLSASNRFFDRVEPQETLSQLDDELPNWRDLPPEIPVFLKTGEDLMRNLGEQMDFSVVIISYTKAVEVLLEKRVFEPFRAAYTAEDVHNDFLKRYMKNPGRNLTLGNYVYIVPNSDEQRLREFMSGVFTQLDAIIEAFKGDEIVNLRNKAAHAELHTRKDAKRIREWAIGILKLV